MKKFFEKVKSLFLILLIIPMLCVFSACKKNNDKNDTSQHNPSIDQPAGGDNSQGGVDDDSGDSGEENPPVTVNKKFNLNVNYALPKYLEGLIEDENLTPEVDEGYVLPTFEETEFKEYFTGWYTTENYEEGSKLNDLKLTAEENSNVSIYAKWDISNIENYFCTSGVQFEFEENQAIPVGYTGTSEIVILPKYVLNDTTTYYVNNIGENCFKDNNIIKELRTSMLDFLVGANSFENSTLEKIDCSKILEINDNAFKNSKIKLAIFSNKLNKISSGIFYGCTELETLDFSAVSSDLVNNVPENMCYGCTKLNNIDLSSKMAKINTSAFENCSSLENIEFLKNSSVTELSNRVFANCVNLDNIEIPEIIVSCGTYVFSGTNISNMTISRMFYNDLIADFSFSAKFGNLSSTLKSITFKGSNITKIYDNYFSGYSELETLVMNNELDEIGNNAFYNCSKLKNITFSTALVGDKLNINAFASTKWYLTIEEYLEEESLNSMVVNGTLVYISSSLTGKFVVADNVTHIVADVFSKNNKIDAVEISKDVEVINKYAFYKSNVKSISVHQDNENYSVISGTLEKFSNGEVLEGVTINYCALYELNEIGKEKTLISYVADKSGGLLVIPETVDLVYNSAFNSNYVPYFVYMSKPSSLVNLTTKFAVEEKAPTGGYLFADSTISTVSSNINASVYKLLTSDKYEVESDTIIVDFDSISGKNFIILESQGVMPDEVVYKYFLIDASSKVIKNVIEIYPNFYI